MKQHRDRLIGFCSVNPLSNYAISSIARCKLEGLTGLKLHLANSHFSFTSEANIAALRRVFIAANARRMPIILHMRTGEIFDGAQAVDVLFDNILPQAEKVAVQVAHLAGWSRYDDVSDSALSRFAERCNVQPTRCARLYFDLAAALPLDPYSQRNRERLQANMRSLGLWRFLFASDSPTYSPATYKRTVQSELPLSPDEIATVLGNAASYLK